MINKCTKYVALYQTKLSLVNKNFNHKSSDNIDHHSISLNESILRCFYCNNFYGHGRSYNYFQLLLAVIITTVLNKKTKSNEHEIKEKKINFRCKALPTICVV